MAEERLGLGGVHEVPGVDRDRAPVRQRPTSARMPFCGTVLAATARDDERRHRDGPCDVGPPGVGVVDLGTHLLHDGPVERQVPLWS